MLGEETKRWRTSDEDEVGSHGQGAHLDARARDDCGGGRNRGSILLAMYLPMFTVFDQIQ